MELPTRSPSCSSSKFGIGESFHFILFWQDMAMGNRLAACCICVGYLVLAWVFQVAVHVLGMNSILSIRGPGAGGQGWSWSFINGTISGLHRYVGYQHCSEKQFMISRVSERVWRTQCGTLPPPLHTLSARSYSLIEQDNPWCKWIIACYVRCSLIDHAFDIYPYGPKP